MASLGIRCGGNRFLDCEFLKGSRYRENGCVGVCGVKMNDQKFDSLGWRKPRMVAVKSAVRSEAVMKAAGTAVVKEDEMKKAAVVHEKMDEWLRDSVVEIVKNLKEAPLLMHVYSEEDERTKVKTEKAMEEENWPAVMERWKKREERLPEGVIFVEKLEEDNVDGDDDQIEDMTRAWGIVVQGRGVNSAPICYLLKTSGADGGGLGLRCTHFCLMRVKSFGETARSQLKNCWLLGGY